MPDGPLEARRAWLRQEGEMRLDPGRSWLPFRAEQWFTGEGIEFRWQARVRMAPLVSACVLDSFEDGRGLLTARVLGFVRVAHSEGAATDRGEAVRGLAELPWRPFAFRESPCLAWDIQAADKLRATFDDGKTQAWVEFRIDDEGHVLGAFASRRPRMAGKALVETDWSGTFAEYRTFAGVRVPTVAEVTWHLPAGPFTYWRGRILEYRIFR